MRRFYLNLTALTVSSLLLICADNLFLITFFWSVCNLLLIFLMSHKFKWTAAKNGGNLALKTFLLGIVFLAGGCGLLVLEAGTASLHAITKNVEIVQSIAGFMALAMILITALIQSGGWPFHRWLISSLNSPTPVSAFMHAGLVNGGGLLLARFAPLYLASPILLQTLFILGFFSLTVGTLWKLMQNDVKRMLACSTMGQMGFMIMQCGLGLFPAAIAHLCWHGLFKAFLFLKAGTTLQEKRRKNRERKSSPTTFAISGLCGLFAAYGFSMASFIPLLSWNTTFVLIVFAWMAGAQLAHTLFEPKATMFKVLEGSVLCFFAGFLYGATVFFVEKLLLPLDIFVPQPMNLIHLVSIGFVTVVWAMMNLKLNIHWENSIWFKKIYVWLLNSSQPHPKTVTAIRSDYRY